MSTQPRLLYDPLLFLLIYLNHIRLHKTLSYRAYSLYFFLIYFIYIFMYITMCYILLLLSCFGCSQYILLLSIIRLYHRHSMLTIQFSHMFVNHNKNYCNHYVIIIVSIFECNYFLLHMLSVQTTVF